MQIAVIPPKHLVGKIHDTHFHLMVPELLHDKNYVKWIKEQRGYKILDNGAAEGGAVEIQDLFNWGTKTNADEIVIPDKLGDAEMTVASAVEFAPWAELHNHQFKFMAVVQGTTYREARTCAEVLMHLEHVDVIALPRILVNTIGKFTRVRLLEELWRYSSWRNIPVHILGMSRWKKEVTVLSEYPQVRSMDSSAPVVLGLERLDIRDRDVDYDGRQDNYFDIKRVGKTQMYYINRNIATFLGWAND